MVDRSLTDGEVVFRVGDPQDSGVIVHHGYVVMETSGLAGEPRSQVLGPGSVFSAADALGGSGPAPRIRAHGEVSLRLYDRAEARAAALTGQDDNGRLLAAALGIRTLPTSAAATPAGKRHREQGTAGLSANGTAIRLTVTERDIADRIGRAEVIIDIFPFVIGRRNDSTITGTISLAILDRRPFQLSRRHFLIDRTDDDVEVRDCGSNNGTIVNGTALGGKNTAYRAALLPGENEIIAGTQSSPFRFLCTIEAGAR